MENTQQADIIDIEEYARAGKNPPKGKKYKIKVDGVAYVVPEKLTGRAILQTAGKTPVERYQLNQKVHGGAVKKIKYDEEVDFTTPGIEKFMTIPLDQTEG
jgi:hypothetical protein